MSTNEIGWMIFMLFLLCTAIYVIEKTKVTVWKGQLLTLPFNSNSTYTLAGETPIYVEGALGYFFALRRIGQNDMIIGMPDKAPLGWEGNYYKTDSADPVPQGDWCVVANSEFRLTLKSEKEFAVTSRIKSDSVDFYKTVTTLIAFLIWVIPVILVDSIVLK